MLSESRRTVAAYSSREHVAIPGSVGETSEEADEIVLCLPDALAVFISCCLWCRGAWVVVERVAPVLGVRPFVARHDIDALCLEEVFQILCVCRVCEVVFVLLCETCVAIVEVRWSPVGIVSVLLAVSPVTREVHVDVEVFQSVNSIVNLNIADIVKRVSAVVLLVEECDRVLCGL